MKTPTGILLCFWTLSIFSAVPVYGQWGIVLNPSFEFNLNTNTEPLTPGAPMGWPYYSTAQDWVGASGVNDLEYDPSGPFHNAGTPVPDGQRVGFKQGGGTVSQELWPLAPGKRHWLQFRYDARNGSDMDVAVRMSTLLYGGSLDEELFLHKNVKPAITANAPYYSRTLAFTPDRDFGILSFEVTTRADSTLLLDAVTVVQRDEGNFVVLNPSFEASGVVFDGMSSAGWDWPAIGGWEKLGIAGVDDGTGGKADNGTVPDQALVAFIEGEGSLSQTLLPLVPGNTYQVEFAYNAQSGTTPHLQVLVGETVLWEQDVTAVGGFASYARETVSFVAAGDTAELTFANTAAGGTLLLDDVKVLGETGTLLPPFTMTPAKALLRVGEEVTGTLTIPEERLVLGDAVIQLRSGDADVFILPDADETGTLSLEFQAPTTSLTFRAQATGVGNAAVDVAEAAGLPFPEDITAIFVVGNTLVLNPSFELDPDSGVANAPVTSWTTGGASIGMAEAGNAFLAVDDLAIPDRRKVLRIQGAGTVSQSVTGLQPGREYGLQFFYNGRTAGYPYELALQVSFAGQLLADIQSIMPAAQDGLTEYYFEEARFTPAEATGLLEFKTLVTSGDATLFLDAVSIVPRLTGEIAVMNSSFEGSAMGVAWPGYVQPNRIAGWTCTGSYGINAYSPKTFFVEPFFDNGINSDQDSALFGQGAVTFRQTVTGLTSGQAYTLVFDYNARDGRQVDSEVEPNVGQMEVRLDGFVEAAVEFPPVDTVSPWSGYRHTKPFYQAFVPFTAFGDYVELEIAHTGVVGDETLVVDNVRIVPGSPAPPTITTPLLDLTVDLGAEVTFAVVASGNNLTYRWLLDGVELVDGDSISGSTTPTLAISNAQASDAGDYSVLVTDGLGLVGSAAMLAVEGGDTVSLTVGLADGKVVLSWPVSASELTLQYAPVLPTVDGDWINEGSPAVENGENWEVQVDPVDAQRFYRLIR